MSSATTSQLGTPHPYHSAGAAGKARAGLGLEQISNVRSDLSASARRLWTIYAISFALWTVFAACSAAGSFLYSIVAQAPAPSWKLLVTWNLSDSYTWALLTPAIYFLSKRYSFGLRNWKIPFLVHAPSAILFAVTGALLTALWNFLLPWSRSHPFAPFRIEAVALFLGDVPRYCLVVAVSQAINYRNQYRERELQSSQLEMQLAHAQLNALKMQIEPHFLFNVLNSIATLTRKDAASAERMTLHLADLLRMSLNSIGRHEVPLRQELDFLECYLQIQHTRFHDRLTVHFDIDPTAMNAAVPHLVLQPLVENAIRHGIGPRLSPGRIEVQVRRQAQRLVLQILDDGVGLPSGFREGSEHGVGLTNTRARLQQLHGDDFEFRCENLPDGGCGVRIVVPFREAEEVQ